MAKKKNKQNKKKNAEEQDINKRLQESRDNSNEYPFVSICTPTFNRRPFIPYTIKCFEHQDYPRGRMEWIIIDDGTDKIEDLVKNVPGVSYHKYDEKMVLGKKRNLMHSKAKGDIIVYMDDDDYYPPDRVSHAVKTLLSNPKALCAGSSIIYIYFKHLEKVYQFGPYSQSHATAGTFAFRKELLLHSSYDDNAALAEEKHFLKNYTIPFVQLDPMKTIVVFSHIHNTFDKRILLEENNNPKVCKPLDIPIDNFVHNQDMITFYTETIDQLLKHYDPGKPSMKPDVLEQIIDIERSRRRQAEHMLSTGFQNNTGIGITQSNGNTINLSRDQIVQLLQQLQREKQILVEENNANKLEIKELKLTAKTDDNIQPNNLHNEREEQQTDDKKELQRLQRVLLRLNEKLLDIKNTD